MNLNTKSCQTFRATIHMAGDVTTIKQICREYCFNIGLCVTVNPTSYIYTGGEEQGAIIGLINYPRFESTPDVVFKKAEDLAEILIDRCYQKSFTIVTDDKTYYYERDWK